MAAVLAIYGIDEGLAMWSQRAAEHRRRLKEEKAALKKWLGEAAVPIAQDGAFDDDDTFLSDGG